ncbi:hypothetical protein TNCV_3980661 [Trichonephila clavipes]|nr:hypothetical protein TNCV_3980661 [Trichonephila clavipes]
MDASKCIVLLQHGSSLNSSRTANPLVRLVEEEERWEALGHPWGALPQIWVELNQIILLPVWGSKLWLTTSLHLAFCRNEFRGPKSDTVRQMVLETTTNKRFNSDF